jgi:hypothetical protein
LLVNLSNLKFPLPDIDPELLNCIDEVGPVGAAVALTFTKPQHQP